MCPRSQYLAAEKVNRASGSSRLNTRKIASRVWDFVDRKSWEMLLWV